jgi:Raf kinase inhibitor-like YbhB/YbcL family protein
MNLTSPAFDDGAPIPGEYGYTEANANPPLEITDVPPDAESLALVMDDPDAREPAGKIWDHWVVWNVDPDVGSIPRDWDADTAVEGSNDFGERGYGGPNPPDREHTYRFVCYALATDLDLGPGASKDDLEAAMEGQVLEEARLTGTYAP